jgi:hypothetical protein
MGVMNFEKVDKIPLIPQMGGGAYNIAVEGSVTANRWHAEGLPAWSSAVDYFGIGFAYESVPVNLDMIPLFPAKTISEDDQCLIVQDSDGDVRLIIPLWLEAGVNATFPLEVMAGNDAVELRKKYPRDLRMVGNIDKMALIEGKEAIDRELERKLPYLLKEGGYLPTVDHGIPPEIPFEHYRHYMVRLKEYLDAYS